MPAKVSTVDKYQGQQNDCELLANVVISRAMRLTSLCLSLCSLFVVILLSLVRTKSAGHIRDIRRLVRIHRSCNWPALTQ